MAAPSSIQPWKLLLARHGDSHGGGWSLASNGYGNGIHGCWPAMETIMVVGGCWPAVDAAMDLMLAGRQWRQPWWLLVVTAMELMVVGQNWRQPWW